MQAKGQKFTKESAFLFEAVHHFHLQFDIANLASLNHFLHFLPLKPLRSSRWLKPNLRAELHPMEKRSRGVCIEIRGPPSRFCTWGRHPAAGTQNGLDGLACSMTFFLDDFVEGKTGSDSMVFLLFLGSVIQTIQMQLYYGVCDCCSKYSPLRMPIFSNGCSCCNQGARNPLPRAWLRPFHEH